MSYGPLVKTTESLCNSGRFERGGNPSFEVNRRRIIAKYLLSSYDDLEIRGACVPRFCRVFGRIRNECSVPFIVIVPYIAVISGSLLGMSKQC
jgi:hypothetical protein